MFCGNCGRPVFDGDDYCTFCGAWVGAETDGRRMNNVAPEGMNNGMPGDMNDGMTGGANNGMPGGRNNGMPGGVNNSMPGGMNGAYGGMPGPGGYAPAGGTGGPTPAPVPAAPKKSGSKAWIFILIGVLVAIAAAAAGIFLFLRANSYERPLRQMVEGIEKADPDKILSSMPEPAVDAMIRQSGLNKEYFAELLADGFATAMEDIGDYKVEYEILSKEDMSESEIGDLEEHYEISYGVDMDIDAAKRLEVEFKIIADETEESQDAVYVIKVDGKWYLSLY